MSRRMLLPLALGALLVGGVPALADQNGSTEQKTVTRSCGASYDDAAADNHFSPPQGSDCKKSDGSWDSAATYQATEYTNDVSCGSSNRHASQSGLNVYAGGDPAGEGGNAGICQDGSTLPVQGRAGLSGSTTDGPKVTIDGDRDNAAPNGNETARGWATVEARPEPAPPAVTCGDEHSQGGRADSDSPQDRDTQAECGSGT